MTPTHHPPDELLLDLAAGRVGEAVALGLATHVSLCARCAGLHRGMEAVGGAILADLPAAEPVAVDLFDRVLARLDTPAPPAKPPPVDPILPAPLAIYAGQRWRERMVRHAVGVRRLDLDLRVGAMPVRLIELPARAPIPAHAHSGDELVVVLAGGFRDDRGSYARGDLALRSADEEHAPRIDADGPCLFLLIHEGPLRATRWTGRWLTPLIDG